MANIGIIGTGWGARVQAPAFRKAGLDVVAIAGRNAHKTKEVASALGVIPVHDWRELVERPDIDLVAVTTPPAHHLEMASAALRAGKHVVCEKPTALNATEAEQLVTVAAAHPDKIAIIDHELRFVPSWRTARERIRELLPLRYIEMRYATSSRSARDRPWNWWSDAAQGGGAWGAFGSHFVDAIRYLGFEIEAAQAVLHTFIDRRPFESELREVTSDDFAAVQLRICGGALADLTFSAVAAGPEEASIVTIHAEKGAVRLTGQELFVATPQDPWTRVEGDVNLADNSAGGAFGRGIYELGCALRVALDHGDRSALAPAATFEDGLAQQRVLDAARRSAAQEGRWEGV